MKTYNVDVDAIHSKNPRDKADNLVESMTSPITPAYPKIGSHFPVSFSSKNINFD